jgi:hypothetical protein
MFGHNPPVPARHDTALEKNWVSKGDPKGILLPTVLRDSLLLLLPPCFYIAKCNKRECCCIWLSGPGFQDLDIWLEDLSFRTSINGHWVSAPRQTHATSEIIYMISIYSFSFCFSHLLYHRSSQNASPKKRKNILEAL